MKTLNQTLMPVAGARWGTAAAGIKRSAKEQKPKLDLALLELAAGSTVAAVFTQNAFCAAPVTLSKKRLNDYCCGSNTAPLYCLINAGNANAGTGSEGYAAAEASCQFIATELGCSEEQVLPFSTGVIGELLPVEKFEQSAKALITSLDVSGWDAASVAILTTDTVAKGFSRKVTVDGKALTLSGIAKGSGMIKPNMATMLSYVVTDAKVSQADLNVLLSAAVSRSLNRITVDGDTSTNDACLLAATGGSGVSITQDGNGWAEFSAALQDLMIDLATAIIRDAEGATKFITLDVLQGKTSDECLKVAYAVAESPLVKTAFFASDANWGRILAAVGRAGVDNLDVNCITIKLDDYVICEHGMRVQNYNEQHASDIMALSEITITIDLQRGDTCERVWTSDLSHDYVRINAEYRT